MINKKKYIPIIKTGEAELRALKFISAEIKNFILPLFELTKGRKKPKTEEGSIENNLKFLENNFKEYPFILDITTDDNLINSEIESFLSSEDNYKKWVEFCLSLKSKFSKFYPTVVVVEEEDYESYIDKLTIQMQTLSNNFDYIVLRAQNETIAKNLIIDLNNIIKKGFVKNIEDKLIFIIDYRYINDVNKSVDIASGLCSVLYKIGIKNIVLSSTSFPKTVSEYMGTDDYKDFQMKEFIFYQNIKNKLNNKNINLIYSDYATANPVRNDNVIFARGWIPRIDIPSLDKAIHCIRKRREKNQTYADVYEQIASKIITKDYFQHITKNNFKCWGLDEIINASNGNVGGSSPRYWISVRINIYLSILQQLF